MINKATVSQNVHFVQRKRFRRSPSQVIQLKLRRGPRLSLGGLSTEPHT